ncbi:hypothetical protein A2801_03175 [Candidatus Woesebacteria bacterium RIFCSPHIGHO2_01_FULL_41_10]|uniref:TIGR02757 family protein n=1 Tax=Candidatus Woesebacteria bacterium RIFCSPHIGHO2_01_FULL_41_10 TaxID=1802500 RepID=A0A1F7YS02_9BACT|nr:MAG: hypothetical protein A2801_03175 [Candidatus Woesebacteria bacterium RIFCSPHIGHO2_01_FULL_41_10]
MNSKSEKDKTLIRIVRLYEIFQAGEIPTLPNHEVNPGFKKDSRENYLYFTLPPCLNFQRSSPAMWASALKTYEDPDTRYLFFPEEVVKKTREQIQKDITKHKLALQPNKHTDIWITICKTLHDHYHDDPRSVLKEGDCDAGKIIDLIQKQKKKLFPYLSGPKMTNYWLYILSYYTDVKLKNMQEISIIPDTHVMQCTIKLGLLDKVSSPIEAAQVWKELLTGSELSPVQMHPVLWNWSRNNFLPEV